jgi:hypothetical protein
MLTELADSMEQPPSMIVNKNAVSAVHLPMGLMTMCLNKKWMTG